QEHPPPCARKRLIQESSRLAADQAAPGPDLCAVLPLLAAQKSAGTAVELPPAAGGPKQRVASFAPAGPIHLSYRIEVQRHGFHCLIQVALSCPAVDAVDRYE